MTQFGWHSIADDVMTGHDLTGKCALVTGISSGLGVETVRALAAHGAKVIGTARDVGKAKKATASILSQFPNSIVYIEADLADLKSVRAAAESIREAEQELHLVIANAGIMATPFERTNEGFELQLGTNYLGHFVLVNEVAYVIPDGGRFVSLSSMGHSFADIEFDDLNFEHRDYDPITAYGASKTANALFAIEFDRRHKSRGVRAAAVHPGGILTELARHMTPELINRMIGLSKINSDPSFARRGYKTLAQGAATTVWAGVAAPADVIGGRYCEDCNVAPVTVVGGGVRPYAVDPMRAKLLWDISEKLVEERYL